MFTEISVFAPNSRKREAIIESLIPKQATNALAERLGVEVGDKAMTAINSMKRNDMDMVQLRFGERRVRIRLSPNT